MADKNGISRRASAPAVSGERQLVGCLFPVSSANYTPWNLNIPRATGLGTISTAIVYMLSLTVVFGVVPTSEPQEAVQSG